MNQLLREKIHRKVDELPENQLDSVANYLEHLTPLRYRATTTEELFKHSGAWGEELGAEIAAIIERDCERIPEE